MNSENKKRCIWVPINNPQYIDYHDQEWGVPVYNDNKHFEMLILEGAQAGLSWETVLNKRENYYQAFKQFIPEEVASMMDQELEFLLCNPGIIRNRLKVFSARKNAQVFLDIQKEFGSYNDYIWQFVQGKPLINYPSSLKNIPTRSLESDLISKDLKKRGMSFVGTTIIYAYMQAVGLVNDHMVGCFLCNRK
ncbi:DNA-3-methyladenine glycosylase 1 [Rickettsiales bacterium Ac37b]|nr:DNA-3-methyladenine glycosylase 1 [Rickettsiales bacterium Ac37b]